MKCCLKCKRYVVHLPRHLRNCHSWTKDKARVAVRDLGLRSAARHKPKPKHKHYHHPRQCPVEGCSASVKRLSCHLQSHKISKGSCLYKRMIAKARKESISRNTGVRRESGEEHEEDEDTSFILIEPWKLDGQLQGASQQEIQEDAAQENMREEAPEQEIQELKTSRSVLNMQEDAPQQITVEDAPQHEMQFVKFLNWMLSPDGGIQNEKSAKQHVTHARVILKAMGKQDMSALWDYSALDTFLAHAEEKSFLPATTKSYLNSLKHLYLFISDTGSCSDTQVRQIDQMTGRVKCWIAAFQKQCSKHSQQKMNDDLGRLVQPQDIMRFKSSPPALSAIKILGCVNDDMYLLSQTDYVTVRDYLVTEIALANANRSGVLATMTLSQFRAARIVDDHYVISLMDHKTAAVYGPAKIVLTLSLYGWLRVYAEKIRPQVIAEAAAPADELFLTWNGEAMCSGQITRCIQSSWKKAGLSSGLTFNILRKSAVSTVYAKRPELSTKLADLMCHRVATGQKCYQVVEREKTSVAASRELAEIFASASQSSLPTQSSQCIPSTSSTSTGVKEQFTWDEARLSALRTCFQSDISSGKVSMPVVREKIKGNEKLQEIGI